MTPDFRGDPRAVADATWSATPAWPPTSTPAADRERSRRSPLCAATIVPLRRVDVVPDVHVRVELGARAR